MTKLNDTQLMILSAAAQRENGAVLPLPKSLKSPPQTIDRALKAMLKSGLLSEQPASRDGAAWREDKKGHRFALTITESGRAALDGAPAESPPPKAKAGRAGAKRKSTEPKKAARNTGKPAGKKASGTANAAPAPRSGTKQQILIDLLRRSEGATIEEATAATGWQAHSVRGFISGNLKKKLGLTVDSEKIEGRGRVYRIQG